MEVNPLSEEQQTRADTDFEHGIAKVTNWEEFWKCLSEYDKMASDETSNMVIRDEYWSKVKTWLDKIVPDYSKIARKAKED